MRARTTRRATGTSCSARSCASAGRRHPGRQPVRGAGTGRCARTGRTAFGKTCQETYAWGLRNPFRFAFDPAATGTRFYINDTGDETWEEIDLGKPGADYGWNVREGPCRNGSWIDCGPAARDGQSRLLLPARIRLRRDQRRGVRAAGSVAGRVQGRLPVQRLSLRRHQAARAWDRPRGRLRRRHGSRHRHGLRAPRRTQALYYTTWDIPRTPGRCAASASSRTAATAHSRPAVAATSAPRCSCSACAERRTCAGACARADATAASRPRP